MTKTKKVRGGLRMIDCRTDDKLKAITTYAAEHAPWRVFSTVLKNVPLRTGVLLMKESLETQMDKGLRGQTPKGGRDHMIAFGRALDSACQSIMTSTGTGLSQQTARVFGVRVPNLPTDSPLVDAGDFSSLSRASERPQSVLDGPFDLLIKMLMYDFMAATTFIEPPPAKLPMAWSPFLSQSKTAEFYKSATDSWITKLKDVLQVFKASPDGRKLMAREEEEDGPSSEDVDSYWDEERLPQATERLAKLAANTRAGVLGEMEGNIILLAHGIVYGSAVNRKTGALPSMKTFRDAIRSQARTEETKVFAERYHASESGAMMSVQPTLVALLISPALLMTTGRLDRKPILSGFELFAMYQRARAINRSEAFCAIENAVWNAGVKVGILGVDPTVATMQALHECCGYMDHLTAEDANVFAHVCSSSNLRNRSVSASPVREEEEEETEDEIQPVTTTSDGPSTSGVPPTSYVEPLIDGGAFLSVVLNAAIQQNASHYRDDVDFSAYLNLSPRGDGSMSEDLSVSGHHPATAATPTTSTMRDLSMRRPLLFLTDTSTPATEAEVSDPSSTVAENAQGVAESSSSTTQSNVDGYQSMGSSGSRSRLPLAIAPTFQPLASTANNYKKKLRDRASTSNDTASTSTPSTHSPRKRKTTSGLVRESPGHASRSRTQADEEVQDGRDGSVLESVGASRGDSRSQGNNRSGGYQDFVSASVDVISDDDDEMSLYVGSRIEPAIKAEDIEQHWLDPDDESDEIVFGAAQVEDLSGYAPKPLHSITVKALDNGGGVVDIQVPVPSVEKDNLTELYHAYSTQFEASLSSNASKPPSFIKLYDSTGSWTRAWTTDVVLASTLFDQRNVFVVKGSADDGHGILQRMWKWDRGTFNIILPGVRHVKVQDADMSGASKVKKDNRVITPDQFITAGAKGYVLRMLAPPPLPECPETLPYSRIFSSHHQSLNARQLRLRELANLRDIVPENENDRDLYNRIRHSLNWSTVMHRGAAVHRHVEGGGAGIIAICTQGSLLYTIFDPRHHRGDSATNVRSVHFSDKFSTRSPDATGACASILVKAGDAIVLPAMTICTFVALEDTIMVGERYIWHSDLPDCFYAFVITRLDYRHTDYRCPELLSIIQSFGSAWGAICADDSPEALDPSYPCLDGADADAQLLKLFVVICAVVFDGALNRARAGKRRLLGSRKMDQLHVRELWVHLTREGGHVVTCGESPEESVKVLRGLIGERYLERRFHQCGLGVALVYVGYSLVRVTEEVEKQKGDGEKVKSSDAMFEDVVADLREALNWSDQAVKLMLDVVKGRHRGNMLPEMIWKRQVLDASGAELRTKPLLWRMTAGSTSQLPSAPAESSTSAPAQTSLSAPAETSAHTTRSRKLSGISGLGGRARKRVRMDATPAS